MKQEEKEKALNDIFNNDPCNLLDISNDDNNKLIAEFMNLAKQHKDNKKQYPLYEHPITGVYEDGGEICYHADWNLLMPVVEKIENLNKLNDVYYTDFSFQATNFVQNYTASFIDRNNIFIGESEGETKLIATYNAVIKFIKWYNLR